MKNPYANVDTGPDVIDEAAPHVREERFNEMLVAALWNRKPDVMKELLAAFNRERDAEADSWVLCEQRGEDDPEALAALAVHESRGKELEAITLRLLGLPPAP